MTRVRRIAILGFLLLAPMGAGGCTLYWSDQPLSEAYPPYPPYPYAVDPDDRYLRR